jgi:plasmid replication initiation protein
MGQKTHPHGLRVGIHRKWNSTWFAQGGEYSQNLAYQRHVEEILQNALQSYAYTKASGTTRLSLVDVRLFKQGMRRLYIFVFFYKFRAKRPRVSVKQNVSRRGATRQTSKELSGALTLRKSWPISRQYQENSLEQYSTETE